ncbi:3-deoxy-manno-octulosonate cytidylyltransferase [Rosistilla oblonga]|uniref:3-deoxy-manno-octulosonate cytidylyltransferase n=1 Tax=Rosistilla oblonga TaxID=2527990 RepID=A0A518IQ84_9BACT|nr:3-deoxy-manno-octulosonate cytidylyltransferase [Rosistilla oblonga]QDV55261.1 3-deoxy-manno-octulosonate cytidylyltransferase [Rosistilla oblonga]
MLNAKIVIPARLASTRLPEKLLRVVAGKSILQRTYEAASRSRRAASMIVAVDDPRLLAEVERFGGNAMMTSVDCQSGTDRVAEAALADDQADVFVNVQGDEPEIDPDAIDLVVDLLEQHPEAYAATLATPIRDAADLKNPNCVKVVLETGGYALYFSRSPIPLPRDQDFQALVDHDPPLCWQHIGLYAYRREVLQWFTQQAPSPLELTERLEQLRLLEAGRRIVVGKIDHPAIGIDTEEDLQAFERKLGTDG